MSISSINTRRLRSSSQIICENDNNMNLNRRPLQSGRMSRRTSTYAFQTREELQGNESNDEPSSIPNNIPTQPNLVDVQVVPEPAVEEMDVSINYSPENRKCITEFASQTTPGLARNGLPEGDSVKKRDSESDNDEQSCPICLEEWTNSGAHRISSLNCGHLFGRSCIEKWLKDPKNKCCPQCKSKANRKNIRNIYAKSLKALDTTDRDQARKELIEEKYKRSKAEEGEARAVLQYQLLKAEMERLKKQVERQEQHVTRHTNRQSLSTTCQSTASQPSCSQSTYSSSQGNHQAASQHLQKISKRYKLERSLQVSTKEARVMAYDQNHMMMIASKPAPNQLFPGYGILKVSSLESRSSEFIQIHQKTIRDAKFNNTGDQLILTASIDKTLKLTSILSNNTVQSYTCPSPVWACAWNDTNTNYVYAGLQNGACCIYDIRKTNEVLASIRPRVGVPCPIVSLSQVSRGDENCQMRCEGVLVGTLQGGWFIEKQSDDTYVDHKLLFPEGSCTGVYFDPKTRHCLLSQRPGKKTSRTTHSIFNLVGDSTENNPLQINLLRQCFGGIRAQALTRSSLFTCPDDDARLMVCAGDEASSSVLVWDGSCGIELQKLPSSGGTIFDVLTFQAYDLHFLATLSEQKLSFYQWQ